MNTYTEIILSMAMVAILSFAARFGWELYGHLAENWAKFLRRKKKP